MHKDISEPSLRKGKWFVHIPVTLGQSIYYIGLIEK